MSDENPNDPLVLYRVAAEPAERLLELFHQCDPNNHDPYAVADMLLEYCADPELRTLLGSGSLELARAIIIPEADLNTQTAVKHRQQRLRTARAVAGYLSRMTTRCTPFGLFVSVGRGRVGTRNDLVIPEPPQDDFVATVLSPYLGSELSPRLGAWTDDHPDPTVYKVRQRIRRYEHRRGVWHLQEFDHSVAIGDIAQPTKIKAPLSATEPRCVENLLSHVVDVEAAPAKLRDSAQALLRRLTQLNGRLTPEWLAAYEACQEQVESLLGLTSPELLVPERKSPRLLLSTRVCSGTVTIGADLVDEIRAAASILHRLQSPRAESPISTFTQQYSERYGSSFVPLLHALDPGLGIGYVPSQGRALEIIDGPLEGHAQQAGQDKSGREGLKSKIVELLLSTACENIAVVELDDEWLGADLDQEEFSVLGCLARDERFLVELVIAGDDLRLLGRFAPDVPGLTEAMRRRVMARRRERTIDAEVVHIPSGPDANVMRRGAVYTHQIVCSGRAAAGTVSIPVNELWIGVEDGELRLWWPRGGCWVLPRLSCAHNSHISHYPVYRFLADLACWRSRLLGWSWGELSGLPRLPAVNYGRVQLAPQTWIIDRTELAVLSRLPLAQRVTKLGELREKLSIPRWVQAGVGDHFIDVDLENPIFVDVALHKAKRAQALILREPRASKTNVVVRGDQSYCNEIVLGFSAKTTSAAPGGSRGPNQLAANRLRTGAFRGYTPGGEWLTLKVYDETDRLEELLIDDLVPWIDAKISQRAVDRWFFLRYADPRPHLRLRLHGDPRQLLAAMGEAHDILHDVDFCIDGYVPETVRYGGEVGMKICEAAFMEDSWLATEIVRSLPKQFAAKRWELSLGVLDNMLNEARVPVENRIGLFEEMVDGYTKVAMVNRSQNRRKLDTSFRARRARIERAIETSREEVRTSGYRTSIIDLVKRQEELQAPLTTIIQSLVHMHLNRVLGHRQLEQEIVVYDYLRRFYRSEAARG